jgi:peptidoglycan hydrolase-like protein with peptidoglycan-binding domain
MNKFMTKNNKLISLGVVGSLIFAMTFIMIPVSVDAATYLKVLGNNTLRVGSRGADVLALQNLLASDKDIYPSGLRTSYFGPLTKAAIIQFQLAYGLTADGLAGPATKNKVNSVIEAGVGIDISGPQINNFSVVTAGRNVTITFNSNEAVKTAIFYDTNPINLNTWDDTKLSLATPTISGTLNTDTTFSLNKQIVLNNLSANTAYHYTVTATDQSGNTSLVWPKTFYTGQ